jgi:hypothetical protein
MRWTRRAQGEALSLNERSCEFNYSVIARDTHTAQGEALSIKQRVNVMIV